MIGPKIPKPTAAQERAAYQATNARDRERCVFRSWDCHGGVQRDHRQNRSQGGRTVASNLQCLCAVHHKAKTENPAWAWANGWGVPGWAKPHEYPARRYVPTPLGTLRLAWVLYDDEGCWEEITHERAVDLSRGLIV